MSLSWKQWLATLLFILGIVLGTLLAGVAVWGDLEAFLFDSAITPEAPLTTLRCPILMTATQTDTVGITLRNTSDRATSFYVRAHISLGFVTLMSEENSRLPLEPGQSGRLEWPIYPGDAAFGRVILVRVHVLPNAPFPYRAASCGIVLVNLPGLLPGDAWYAIGLVISLACAAGGIALWITSNRPLQGRALLVARVQGALIGAVSLSVLFAVLKLWLVGLIGIIIILLLAGVIIGHLVTTAR